MLDARTLNLLELVAPPTSSESKSEHIDYV